MTTHHTITHPTVTHPTGATGTHTVRVVDAPLWQRAPRYVVGQLARLNRLSGVRPAGWLLFLIVVVTWIVGGRFGWLELRLISVFGAVLLLGAVLFMIGRQSYQVTLNLERHQVVVGERALGELRVVNTSHRRLFPARIELPVGRRVASFALPSLGGQASFDEVFAVPTARRSVIRVGPARTVRGDPFRLMGREILWTGSYDLFVHPRTIPLPGRRVGFIRDLEGHVTPEISNSDVSFHALREYQPGDDRRYVHWRSSAHVGTLMVRQFEETRRSHLAIGLDLAGNNYTCDEEFELAVSVVASLGLQALRDESGLGVLTTAGRLRAATPRGTLDQLCLVEMESRGGLVAVTRDIVRYESGASIVAVVSGGHCQEHDLRRACTLLDLDTRVVAIRVELGAELATRTIDNVTVMTVGSLIDLPTGMRKAML